MTRWNPTSFLRQGRAKGYSEDFLQQLISDGKVLRSKNLPVVYTLEHLAELLEINSTYLSSIVSRKRFDYRIFYISKKSGGKRQIVVPSQRLLKTQRWIAQNILNVLPVSAISTAYSKGNNPYKNAHLHCGTNWLVKIDLKNFFESIKEQSVYYVFRNLGYSKLLSFQLARICTMATETNTKGYLPQGAPSSPVLSNLVCLAFDDQLTHLAAMYGCEVSRYADDIIFSSLDFNKDTARNLIRDFDELVKIYKFKRNFKKTTVIHPNARKIVTGLKVNGPEPKLQKEYKDRIRAHLYFAKKYGIAEHCRNKKFESILGFKNHLEGLINFAISVEIDFGEKCKIQFNDIPWPEL